MADFFRYRLSALLVFVVLAWPVAAQDYRCGTDLYEEIHGSHAPDVLSQRSQRDDGRVFVIPVVFHIMHQDGIENIPDAAILTQIDVMNEDFGRYGGGANNNPLGGDMGIRFCLATRDPDGNPTTGIVRVQTPQTDTRQENDRAMKDLSRWDPRRYLNIWVVRSINGPGSGILGYAYLPPDVAGKEQDGVVLWYRIVGRNQPYRLPNFRMGHTASHEAGHYLNLLHPWGDRDDCRGDDGVGDTPPCAGIYYAEFSFLLGHCDRPIQCANQPRQTENHMDYSEERCLNLFTRGQRIRMRQAILNYREGLVTTPNTFLTGCQATFDSLNASLKVAEKIEVYANPAVRAIDVYPNLSEAADITLDFFSLQGQYVGRLRIPNALTERHSLAMPHWPGQMFIVQVRGGSVAYTTKLLFL